MRGTAGALTISLAKARPAMAESGEPPYDVGYAKPPSKTRFKPGQSGNPTGRPRGAKNFVTAIEDELRARVTVTENGRRKRVTKREVIAKRLVYCAAEGVPG